MLKTLQLHFMNFLYVKILTSFINLWSLFLIWCYHILLASLCCKTNIILMIVKNLVICQCSYCVSSSCNHWLWSWCINFSESSSQIQEAVWKLFFFSCHARVCYVLHCWIHSSYSDSAIRLLFFLCHFIQYVSFL